MCCRERWREGRGERDLGNLCGIESVAGEECFEENNAIRGGARTSALQRLIHCPLHNLVPEMCGIQRHDAPHRLLQVIGHIVLRDKRLDLHWRWCVYVVCVCGVCMWCVTCICGCICIYVYICTCINECVFVCVCGVCMWCVVVYLFAYVVCVCGVCMWCVYVVCVHDIRVCVYVYVCIYVHMYICICIYMYVGRWLHATRYSASRYSVLGDERLHLNISICMCMCMCDSLSMYRYGNTLYIYKTHTHTHTHTHIYYVYTEI